MGDECGVDTLHFRRAIWTYIQSLYGIRHDDYDYAIVNHLVGGFFRFFFFLLLSKIYFF
jgi:sestrin